MQLMTNLKTKYKLVLMLLFPLLGFLYFSVTLIAEKAKIASEMSGLAELTQLSINLSDVVHDLQLERGSSVLFLTHQGQEFANDMSHYRTQTDLAISSLNDFLKIFHNHSYADFDTTLENVLNSLDQLRNIREDITALRIQLEQAVLFYDDLNKAVFQFLIQSTQVSYYKELFPLKLAYINFLNAKEKAGQERSLLVAVFNQGGLSLEQFQKFAELVSAQDTYLNHEVMTYLTPSQKDLLKSKLSTGQFIEETQKMRAIVLTADEKGKLTQQVDPKQWFQMQTGKINLLKEVSDTLGQNLYTQAQTTQQIAYQNFITLLATMVVVTTLTLLLLVLILKTLHVRLTHAMTVMGQIAEGHFDNKIDTTSSDELGQLLRLGERMQTQLRERSEENQRITEEALRVNRALDWVTTSVLITDENYRIIYQNEAAQHLFQKDEKHIRLDLPHFYAHQLQGANIDSLHKHPTHQRELLSQLHGSHRARVHVGNLTLEHTITPVVNPQGERKGIVVEFQDRSVEVAMEQEINRVIQAASEGDFRQQIMLGQKTGAFRTFSEGINQVLDYNQSAVADIMRITAALAQGDLTQTIENQYKGSLDQLKNDINTTVQKLTEVITVIQHTVHSIHQASEDLTDGNIRLSQRTEEQAASLQETAASMEQMTSSVQQNADNAKEATKLAIHAKDRAQTGGEVVQVAIQAMIDISHSSQKITEIIGVIDEIAFQTNLLALNAAVEAARAGEQGRGFAVVAAEVRNLAQRSATAAKEIKNLIVDSVTRIQDGTKLAHKSGETLADIVGAVKKVSDIIAEISAASQEQSTGIHQVNKAIAQMDEVTQQNASMVEQAASASEAMRQQAQALSEQVAFFKLVRTED